MALRIALFGCGTIGTEIATAVDEGIVDGELVRVYDRNEPKVRRLIDAVGDEAGPVAASDPAELATGVDLVVEAAGQAAVEAAVDVLRSGTDVLAMSVGALADDDLRAAVFDAAAASGARLYAPSGAIAGIDAVSAAAVRGGLDAVTLTTRKPPAGLAGAPYVEANGIDLDAIEDAQVIFEGSARAAASAFPANVNVAVTLSLAGVGPDDTAVRIVADPAASTNVHEIHAEGGAGTISTTVSNVPSPSNPKTSYLASLAAIERLRALTAPVDVGT